MKNKMSFMIGKTDEERNNMFSDEKLKKMLGKSPGQQKRKNQDNQRILDLLK
jgi:hypothetical protein